MFRSKTAFPAALFGQSNRDTLTLTEMNGDQHSTKYHSHADGLRQVTGFSGSELHLGGVQSTEASVTWTWY